jgi:hypothetical protein
VSSADYTIELRTDIDPALYANEVYADEIDEDPPSVESGQFGADPV